MLPVDDITLVADFFYNYFLKKIIMALSKAKSPNLLEDKQTVVTNLARTNAIGLKMFLNDKLPKWIENRKCPKILVICGAHGETDGSIVEEAQPNSLHNLKVSH